MLSQESSSVSSVIRFSVFVLPYQRPCSSAPVYPLSTSNITANVVPQHSKPTGTSSALPV